MEFKMKNNLNYKIRNVTLFLFAFYFLALEVKPAKADCVDVTKKPCFCDIFDIPYDGSTMNFLWLLYRRDLNYLNKLKSMKIHIDTCNLDYIRPCPTSFDLKIERCLYFKQYEFIDFIEFGFIKNVNSGDTLDVSDLDSRNVKLINFFEELKLAKCPFRIIVDYFDPLNKNYFVGRLLFDSYINESSLESFYIDMKQKGYDDYFSSFKMIMVFDYTTDEVNEEIQNDGLVINQSNSDELIIHYNQFEKNDQVEIYDLLGICQIRSEINSSAKVLDISQLPRGVYFVKIGNQVTKFMRE
jgi:hypothetical protein